jgi:hypothetical protein
MFYFKLIGEVFDQFIKDHLLKIGYAPRYLVIPFITNSVISPAGCGLSLPSKMRRHVWRPRPFVRLSILSVT